MKKSLQVLTFGLALSTAFAMAQTNPSTSGQMGQQPAQAGTYQNGQQSQPSQPSAMPDTTANSTSTTASDSKKAQVDDQTIQRQVHEQLATNPDLQNIQVSVDKGKVSLTGSVPSKKAKEDAKKLAKSVSGVKKVKEELSVASNANAGSAGNIGSSTSSTSSTGVSGESNSGAATSGSSNSGASSAPMSEQPPTTSNPNNTPNATNPAGPPHNNLVSQDQHNGDQSSAAGQNSGHEDDMNAGAAGNAVKQEPKAQDSKSEDSAHTPDAGQSSDTGASSSASSPAGQSSSASSTTGANGESVDQVKSDIKTAFSNEPTLSSSNITVDATSDTITLSGSAPSEKDRDEARRIAQSFAGNRKVVDNISVSGGAGAGTSSDMNTNPSSNTGSSPNSTTGTTPNSNPDASTTTNQNPEQPNTTPKK